MEIKFERRECFTEEILLNFRANTAVYMMRIGDWDYFHVGSFHMSVIKFN
jgi:hypothetical protein